MSKFKIGDRFTHGTLKASSGKIIMITDTNYHVVWDSSPDIEKIHKIVGGDKYWVKLQSHKNQVIDQMNAENHYTDALRYLSAGEVWQPGIKNETKPETVKCIHTWRTVTLFTSIVEECSKCGITRELP